MKHPSRLSGAWAWRLLPILLLVIGIGQLTAVTHATATNDGGGLYNLGVLTATTNSIMNNRASAGRRLDHSTPGQALVFAKSLDKVCHFDERGLRGEISPLRRLGFLTLQKSQGSK